MTFEIRPVRAAEHEELGALTVAAYTALEGGGDLGDYAKQLADVATRAEAAEVLVAVGDGLLGGVTFVPAADNPYAEDLREGEVGIRMLAVSPAAQGRGVGRALSVACIERARAVAARQIALHSTPWMTTAHGLYTSLGFVRTPDRDLRVAPDVLLLSFVLVLDPPR